jgi:hypothetical protein
MTSRHRRLPVRQGRSGGPSGRQGGSGNGPNYVEGPLQVLPPDPFDLDGHDNDGIGCESG